MRYFALELSGNRRRPINRPLRTVSSLGRGLAWAKCAAAEGYLERSLLEQCHGPRRGLRASRFEVKTIQGAFRSSIPRCLFEA